MQIDLYGPARIDTLPQNVRQFLKDYPLGTTVSLILESDSGYDISELRRPGGIFPRGFFSENLHSVPRGDVKGVGDWIFSIRKEHNPGQLILVVGTKGLIERLKI